MRRMDYETVGLPCSFQLTAMAILRGIEWDWLSEFARSKRLILCLMAPASYERLGPPMVASRDRKASTSAGDFYYRKHIGLCATGSKAVFISLNSASVFCVLHCWESREPYVVFWLANL